MADAFSFSLFAPPHLNSLILGLLGSFLFTAHLPQHACMAYCYKFAKVSRSLVLFKLIVKFMSNEIHVKWVRLMTGTEEEQGLQIHSPVLVGIVFFATSILATEDDVCKPSLYIRLHCPIYANIFPPTTHNTHPHWTRVVAVWSGCTAQLSCKSYHNMTWH